MIIAEGHVKMTLWFSICSKYAVTLKAIKTGNFLRRELLSLRKRKRRIEDEKKNRGGSLHTCSAGSEGLLDLWRKDKAWEDGESR